MLRLALQDVPGLALDLRELGREGRSWTVDTLRELRRETGGERPVALLVGADSFVGLPAWKEWEALFGLAHFVVASRDAAPLAGDMAAPLEAALAGRTVPYPHALRPSAA